MAGRDQQVRTRTESSISKKVWRDHKEQMKRSLSVAIFPFLVKDSLIPGTDRLKYVDPKTTEVKKLDIIIGSVPRSGHPDYVLKFIKCLRDSSQVAGQAHEQLADLLEVAYNKHKENGTRWSISQTVTTTWELGSGNSTTSESVRLIGTRVARGVSNAEQHCSHNRGQSPYSMHLLKKYWKWISLHSSAFLWLLLGAILSGILAQVPPINENQPTYIYGHRNILVNLGIDPFWVSSAEFSIQPSSCSGSTMYVVKGSTCKQLPNITRKFDQDDIVDFEFMYLLPGSAINITVKQRDSLENIEIWILQSIANYNNMRRSSLSCDHPPDKTWCYRANEYAGQPLPPFNVNTADYYFLFVNTVTHGLHHYTNYTVMNVTFNMTAIQEQYQQMGSKIEHRSKVNISQPFSSNKRGLCVILSAECPESNYMLKRDEITRRIDIMLSPMIVGLFVCVLHLLVSCCVHFGYVRSTCIH